MDNLGAGIAFGSMWVSLMIFGIVGMVLTGRWPWEKPEVKSSKKTPAAK